MPVFKNEEARVMNVPAGDYVFCVKDMECGIQQGGKTGGSDNYALTLDVEGKNCTVYETLIDHPSCAWKINTFLKCAGVKLAEGEAFDFNKANAEANNVKWINPIGLRGHMSLLLEEYTPKSGGDKKKRNKVGTFYTDRAKLAPNESMRQASDEQTASAEESTPF